MDPSIPPKKTTLFLIALLLACSALAPGAQLMTNPPRVADHLGLRATEGKNASLAGPSGSWKVVPSRNTGHPNNYLLGVAAIAPNDVWAVGAYGNLTTQAQTLIQHWDGQKWTMTATPTLSTSYNELLAISAVSANDLWAVGSADGKGLIEHWDGSSWSVVVNPNPGTGNRFFGVAATSSNDVWTVGYQVGVSGLSQTLVEHWDGTSWQIIPSPNIANQHNQLNAVTVVPGSPNDLWAVGEAGPSALILHWNGTQWSIVTSPNAGTVPRLMNVVAVSANDVWAVGWTGGTSGPVTLTEHWNGSTWAVVPSPNPSSTFNYLHGVTAVAANNIWAVGEFNATGGNQQSLFLQWNGSAWVQVAGDNAGPSGVQFFVSAVSAMSGSDIWSVGNNSHALAEHWNGTSWNIVATPNAGLGDNMLNGVSGAAATDVWEVGYYVFGTWKGTLIEHWNGTRWSIVRSPNTSKRTNILNAVKAISPSDAWVVGSADSGVADQTTLTLHWNGARWIIVPSPSPGTLGLNVFYGVGANTANDVWAVGSYTNVSEFAQTLAAHWDGTTWSVIPSANVLGDNNELYDVVALSPNDVWAIGYHGNAAFGFSTLVEHWDGVSWSIVSSPSPSGNDILYAVSATAANDIWAVGRSLNTFNFQTSTLIEHWDGNSWSQVSGFGVGPSSVAYGVAAVSPGDAWAVGDNTGLSLIGRWDGSNWSVSPSPNVAARLNAATAITPCDVWAVGQRYVTGVANLTLTERFTCD